MKNNPIYIVAGAGLLALAATTGCRTDYGAGSPYQPGPTAGKDVGAGVGVVAGNVAGFGVGVVQGTTHGIASTFDPSYHMVRYWKTETTPDGRTIQVPEDILVDSKGRPVAMPPTAPPRATPPPAAPAPVAAPAAPAAPAPAAAPMVPPTP